jgi:diacylglycerol kinase (ATP)
VRKLFIINANSGRSRDRQQVIRLIGENCVAGEFEIVQTKAKEDLDDIFVQGRAAEFDVLCAVGGDGTVNELGRRLINSERALAILPAGSGNGLARHLQISMNIATALADQQQSEIVTIDTASVNGHPFLGTFGIGFDALVAHRFAVAGTRGIETYVTEALRTFMSYSAEHYEIELDGEKSEIDAFLVAIGNSNQYGNEAKITPLASLRDGLLDVAILKWNRLIDAPDIIRRLFLGSLRECSYLATHRAKHVVIHRTDQTPAHIDGEPVVLDGTLDISIHPKSLKVLVPKKAAKKI